MMWNDALEIELMLRDRGCARPELDSAKDLFQTLGVKFAADRYHLANELTDAETKKLADSLRAVTGKQVTEVKTLSAGEVMRWHDREKAHGVSLAFDLYCRVAKTGLISRGLLAGDKVKTMYERLGISKVPDDLRFYTGRIHVVLGRHREVLSRTYGNSLGFRFAEMFEFGLLHYLSCLFGHDAGGVVVYGDLLRIITQTFPLYRTDGASAWVTLIE